MQNKGPTTIKEDSPTFSQAEYTPKTCPPHSLHPLQSIYIINPRYSIVKLIYQASIGYTKLTLLKDNLSGQHLILKQMMKVKLLQPQQWEAARREVSIASLLNHPNIVQIYDTGQLQDSFYILMEFIQNFDYFHNKIEINNRPFNLKLEGDTQKLKSVTSEILNGLAYLHSLGLVHMDIKPSNLPRSPSSDPQHPKIKIIDFGLSKVLIEGCARIPKKCGTYMYMAPQVQDGASVTSACDIWSFGILVYNLTVGYFPTALN